MSLTKQEIDALVDGMARGIGDPPCIITRLREVEAERDKWHNLVKSLCDEWNDECPPGCDSYAHEDDCGATSITVAMRKRGEEIATLRAERDALVPLLQYFVEYVEDGVDEDEAPKHDCAFRSNPEAGYCEFHEQWAAARAILDRLGKEAK